MQAEEPPEGEGGRPGGRATVTAEAGAADGNGGGRATGAPPTQPYARAAAFAAYDVTRQRELARTDEGALLSTATEASRATTGLLGEVGVEHQGERRTARVGYVLGVQAAEGAEVGLDDVTQGLDAALEARATERATLSLRLAGFWGVRDSESVIEGAGLGAPADPSRPRPAATTQRRISRVPFLRLDGGTGATWSDDVPATHRLDLGASALIYPDHEVVHASGERLFETWTLGPEYALELGLTERDTLTAAVEARTTWYAPVYTVRVGASTESPSETLDPVEAVAARVGWRRLLDRRWSLTASGGLGAAIPLAHGNPDTGSSMTLVGGAGTAWGAGPWRLQLDADRALAQSEVGAVFATTSARFAGQRAWASGLLARLGASASRYDVLTQVFTSRADLEDFASASSGASLSQGELEARARRAQEGYGFQGTADLGWQFWGFAGMSIAYVVERRWSDDPDRGDRLVHRVTLGLTLTTREAAPVDLEPLEGE